MKKKWTGILLMSVCLAAGLTGCVGKATGGDFTRQGMEAIENLDYAGAASLFDQALTGGEDAVPAYRGQGMAYMGLARYEEAVEAFDLALEYTDSKMPETVKDILLYKASAQFRMKDYENTITTCEELLKEEEALAEGYYLMGASCLNLGYEERARENFDLAVKAAPQDYNLYLNIYESYRVQNLSAVGDEYLQTALSIPPESAEDYYCIGQIYYNLEQYDQVQSALIVPVEEKYPPALYLAARVYLAKEDYAHALSAYETIKQEYGDSPQVCNGLALCSMAEEEYDQALAYIQQGLAMEEEQGKQELLFNEIVVYERMLDFDAAKEKAESYAALYPTDEAGRKELAFLSTR